MKQGGWFVFQYITDCGKPKDENNRLVWNKASCGWETWEKDFYINPFHLGTYMFETATHAEVIAKELHGEVEVYVIEYEIRKPITNIKEEEEDNDSL